MFGNKIKRFIVGCLIVVLFFVGLELTQRIRYSIRWKRPYWIGYGFVPKPLDYDEKQGNLREEAVGKDICVPTIDYETKHGQYYKYRPGFKFDATVKGNGFRDNFINYSEDKKTIICMGGSTTFGIYNTDEETYPYQLARMLPKYNVINCGIEHYRLGEVKTLLLSEVLDMKPDIITLNNTFNNFHRSAETYTHSSRIATKIHFFLMNKSLFYLTLKEKLCTTRMDDLYKISLREIKYNFTNGPFFSECKNKLQEISDICKENNIELYVMEEPVYLNNAALLLNEDVKYLYDKYNDMLSEIKNIRVIRTQKYFNSDQINLFTGDGLHLKRKGNKLIAEIIAGEIGGKYE